MWVFDACALCCLGNVSCMYTMLVDLWQILIVSTRFYIAHVTKNKDPTRIRVLSSAMGDKKQNKSWTKVTNYKTHVDNNLRYVALCHRITQTLMFEWYTEQLVVNNGHQKRICHVEIGLCPQILDTILNPTLNTNRKTLMFVCLTFWHKLKIINCKGIYVYRKTCMILLRSKHRISHWPHVTFASRLRIWSLKWQSCWLAEKIPTLINHMP